VSRRHEGKPELAGEEDNASDVLDEQLRQLGEEFLDEQVPDTLLDVLRRGMANRSQPAEAEKDELSESHADQAEKSDDKR
jgi:hypothetical protein